jgi:hypothetical protein
VIGENAGDSADAVITACFNKGQVSGDLYVYVGGVAGSNYSMSGQNAFITASYNMGTVIGNGSTGIGGVVGKNEIATNSAAVTACYNSGAVTGTGTNIGGVVGEIVNGATNTACYWYAGVANNVAVNGVGSAGNNAEATPFGSAGDWPVINTNLAWGTGSGGPAGYWKSLGSWNNGSPVFPKLYWE